MSRAGKIAVVVVGLLLLMLGLWGITTLELGLEPQLAAPSDFYLVDYYNTEFTRGEAGPPLYLVVKDLDYAEVGVRNALRNLSRQLSRLESYVQSPVYSWLDALEAYMDNENLPPDCPVPDPSQGFYANAKTFLSIPIETPCCQTAGICGEQYQTDVVFGPKNTGGSSWAEGQRKGRVSKPDASKPGGEEEEVVVASRLRLQLQPLRKERDFIDSYYYLRTYVREFAAAVPERYSGQGTEGGTSSVVFPYSLYFVYYEQYTYIQGVALTNVCLALLAVGICTAILTGSVAIAGVVVGMVLWIMLGMVGILAVWNRLTFGYPVRINAVSVVNLVMATGLAVEFVVHIAGAYLTYPAGEGEKRPGNAAGNFRVLSPREKRAWHALSSMGASVLCGITLTKLVGIAVLAVAPSHLFRVYYFRMYVCLICVGAFVGLALLPVLLAAYGPLPARLEGRDGGVYSNRKERQESRGASRRKGRKKRRDAHDGVTEKED
jgi:Niemann-Pick C1 protein